MDVRSEDQSSLDADVMHHHTTEVATNHHEAESERVAGIDEMG